MHPSQYVDYTKKDYITVAQYCYLKTSSTHPSKLANSLTNYEAKLFGIKKKPKWFNSNKDKKIDINVARNAARSSVNSIKLSSFVKKRMLHSLFYGVNSTFDEKFVYLFVNENHDSKIGVSKDPIKRANNIRTSSGYDIHHIHYWAVKDSPFRIESVLHKKVLNERLSGEWFDGMIDPDELEQLIECECVRIC